MITPLSEEKVPANCFVFKHSTQCPISARAAAEVRAASTPVRVLWVNVIEQRPLSNWLASHLGVEHESPQLILVRNGKAAEVWSHAEVVRERLNQTVK